ncbi:helix-turn-helix domain-containing protein [Paracraurococcus lichenis]|uniref:Helix-turn-helix domain-containing protein n=1 Tax=Paracraurococcus lichenis TaxID=3064888 RepID=A0ABT9EA26_9PROT|nr:helix-turn-helix domain-containing protein [Paracraurococcus sp. LOR1-02]MDO9712823.1 helix-turn-helix domain-containing protein [Paracraurococcus sp. LOR1-02]
MARHSGASNGPRAEPDPLLQAIGSRIREARKRAGLTGSQLAETIGTNKTWIYSIEDGRQNVTIQGLRRLLRALGLEIQEVMPSGPDLSEEMARVRRLHNTSSALILLLVPLLDELRELQAATAEVLGAEKK